MSFAMNFFYSIVALLLSAKSLQVSASSCCLRTNPMHRLKDGLYLQAILLMNRDEGFMFLPNAAELVSHKESFSQKFELVENLIKLLQQRDSLDLLKESKTVTVHRKLMNAVISDSCNYLTELLKDKIDCNSKLELQVLASRFELYRTILSLDDNTAFIRWGSPKNRFAYWNETVLESCTPCTCPHLEEIKPLMGFVVNADKCPCS